MQASSRTNRGPKVASRSNSSKSAARAVGTGKQRKMAAEEREIGGVIGKHQNEILMTEERKGN